MINNSVLDFMILIENDFIIFLMKIFSFIGSFYGVLIILILFLILSKSVYKKKLVIYTIIVTLLNNLLKIIFLVDRPNCGLVYESSYSFPSGHAMINTFVLGFLVFYIKKECEIKKVYKIICMVFIILILFLICFSRVYLRVHYLSDVLVGCILGFLCLVFFIKHKK